MDYSNPIPPYYPYPTTTPTFSPFPFFTIPPTYSPPTTIQNPSPHPNTISQTFPSYPYPNYSSYYNYYQSSCLSPSTTTHNTTHTLQQQPPPTHYSTFPSYPHHLHDPSYHPPPNFTHPHYSSYPNSTTSPLPNHYTSYPTSSSPSEYPYQTPIFNHSQPIAAITIPDVENLRSSLKEILELLTELQNERKESSQDIKQSFQEVSESLKSRGKHIQDVFSKITLRQDFQEKIIKEKVEEHTAEEPKKFVDGGDLPIIQEEDKEKKEQESEPYHDFQSTPLCQKLPPPQFLSSLSSQAPAPTPKSPESNTFTVAGKLTVAHPSPLKLPPPKPPDKVFPMFSSPSPKLQPPPENVFFPFSPFSALSRPPPEPPDLQSTSESTLPLPTTSRPPRKPPDRSVLTTHPSHFDSVHLRKHRSPIFQSPSDTILWESENKSWPFNEKNCHVSNCLSPSEARDILVFWCISIFYAPAVVLLQECRISNPPILM